VEEEEREGARVLSLRARIIMCRASLQILHLQHVAKYRLPQYLSY
jgi:hypothetical protein